MRSRNQKSGIGFFLRANPPILTPKPEHVRADIESVGPCDDPVIDESLGEENLVDKGLGNRAVHFFEMALEIKLGNQAVFVGDSDLEIAVDSHRLKSWSHSNPSILLSGCINPHSPVFLEFGAVKRSPFTHHSPRAARQTAVDDFGRWRCRLAPRIRHIPRENAEADVRCSSW